ncbi:glycosyltransferase [Myceligenerans crystallogenes]|uniref:DUF624 domain-containing protein n=1 Tax=Myceligenerans crystallogenes TaxID=316335 RepID=A0ABN2N243_9MICO
MSGEGGDSAASAKEFGEGPLARVTNVVYWYLVTGLLMVVAALPGAVPMQFLESSPGNAPVLALCLAPLGPAFAAGLYGLRDRRRSEGLTPARSFFRGYRLNWSDALWMTLPGLVYVAIGGLGAGVVGDGGALAGSGVGIITAVPGVYLGLLIVLGVAVVLWTMHALVIVSFFSFRVRDVARLAAYYLFAQWRVTLGGLLLVVVAGLVLLTAGDIVVGALGVVWSAAVLWNHAALVSDVEKRFVRPGDV